LSCRGSSGAIVNQHGGSMNLARKTNGLPLTRIDLQSCIDRARLLYRYPAGTALHPFVHRGGRVGLLQLSEDSRRYKDPLEKARQ
jgi:hypothetical protein